jgi:hypothetical protein
MISDLDIWRAAQLLIRKHGAEAELEAARLQDTDARPWRWREPARVAAERSSGAGAAVWQTELTPVGAEVRMKTRLAAAVIALEDATLPYEERGAGRSARRLVAGLCAQSPHRYK